MSTVVEYIFIILALVCLIPVLILFAFEAAYFIEGISTKEESAPLLADVKSIKETAEPYTQS